MPYIFFIYFIVFTQLAFINPQPNQDMVEQGRIQYQLLQEKKNLPTYGTCWKSAIQHIEEGCQSLSEDTQSTIALHLANCFLEMSGHESYNCELEKKSNLKQICISSMSDRAFNVYTEFYTHTQNMCWFLRGQIWHETMTENAFQISKQLEQFFKNQENILSMQQESLEFMKITKEFFNSIKMYQEAISVMSSSLRSLETWLIGEFSWIDLVVFYVSTSIFIVILTSSKQTAGARFPIWILLIINAGVERCICGWIVNFYKGVDIYSALSTYVWWSRRCFYTLTLFTLLYFAYRYKDLQTINYDILQKVYNQNLSILNKLDEFNSDKCAQSEVSYVQEKCNTLIKQSSYLKNPSSKTVDTDSFSSRVHLERYNLRSKSRSPWDRYC